MLYINFILILAALYIVKKIQTKASISKVVAFGLFTYIITWLLTPCILVVLDAAYNDGALILTDFPDYVNYFSIEISVTVVSILLFYTIKKNSYSWISNVSSLYKNPRPKVQLIICVAIITVHAALNYYILSQMSFDYQTVNEYTVSTDKSDTAVITTFTEVSAVLFSYLLIVYVYLNKERDKSLQPIKRLLFTYVLAYSLMSVILGSRWMLLLPVVMILIEIKEHNTRFPLKYVALFIVTAVMSPIVLYAIGTLRQQSYDLSDIGQTGKEFISSSSVDQTMKLLAVELQVKLDSVGSGALLLEDGLGSGGVQTIESALVSIVPRAIYPEKPVPGSSDGEYSGTAPRIVAAKMGMGLSGNAGVSPVLQSLWELGWLGIILFLVLLQVHLMLINSLLMSDLLILKTLGLAFLGIPLFVWLVPSPDIIIKTDLRLLLYILLVLVALYLLKSLRERLFVVSTGKQMQMSEKSS